MSQPPKGLATIAYLKTQLDEGRDHLSLFEPLVLDALCRHPTSDFIAGDIKTTIFNRTGISVPVDTVQALLGRCTKRGLLERRGGRYFRTSLEIPDPKIEELRAPIATGQLILGQRLRAYAQNQSIILASDSDALDALATFVSDNKVPLVLTEPLPDTPLERSTLSRKLTRTVARFISEVCLQSQELRPALSALTEGIVLLDTLLLSDIPKAGERFQDLVVVFDSPVLFAAIDLYGIANGLAAREGLLLLRESGARAVAFDRTVQEMQRILAVYEDHLKTTTGRLSLFPTPLTQHVLVSKLSSADIRVISTTLSQRLQKAGIAIREIPKHEAPSTLGEQALAIALADPKTKDADTHRVRHDVDCIAGVLTLRKTFAATSIERCRAIFCTSSGRVIRTTQDWYSAQGGQGVPPIIHQAALTSIAWLKKPAAAPNLKLHELVALCSAAIRPTRDTWNKCVSALRKLRDDGSITDDEVAAVVASELTEPLLSRLDDEFEPDSDSIAEAIHRVQESYREQMAIAAESAIKQARSEAAIAERAASDATERSTRMRQNIDSRTRLISRWLANIVLGVFGLVAAAACVLSLPNMYERVPDIWRWAAYCLLAAAGLLGVLSLLNGVTLFTMRSSIENWLHSNFSRWFLPDQEDFRPAESLSRNGEDRGN